LKILILYDTFYGNTEKLAYAIASALHEKNDVKVLKIKDFENEMLNGIELLIIGSPNKLCQPTRSILKTLRNMDVSLLKGLKYFIYDTRINNKKIKPGFIRSLFINANHSSKKIARILDKKGAEMYNPPEGFYINGLTGPLLNGELERAADFIKI